MLSIVCMLSIDTLIQTHNQEAPPISHNISIIIIIIIITYYITLYYY